MLAVLAFGLAAPALAEEPELSTAEIASPPGTGALIARIRRIRRVAILPRDMMLPARMNSGMDNSTSLLAASQASMTM